MAFLALLAFASPPCIPYEMFTRTFRGFDRFLDFSISSSLRSKSVLVRIENNRTTPSNGIIFSFGPVYGNLRNLPVTRSREKEKERIFTRRFLLFLFFFYMLSFSFSRNRERARNTFLERLFIAAGFFVGRKANNTAKPPISTDSNIQSVRDE